MQNHSSFIFVFLISCKCRNVVLSKRCLFQNGAFDAKNVQLHSTIKWESLKISCEKQNSHCSATFKRKLCHCDIPGYPYLYLSLRRFIALQVFQLTMTNAVFVHHWNVLLKFISQFFVFIQLNFKSARLEMEWSRFPVGNRWPDRYRYSAAPKEHRRNDNKKKKQIRS